MCPLSSVTGLFQAAERRVERGQRCALLIYGQSGAGKTTLLKNHLLNNDKFIVGMGKANQFGALFPYRPVLEAIGGAVSAWLARAGSALTEDLKTRVRGAEDVLSILIPELAHWARPGAPSVLTPEQSPQIMPAIRRLLAGLCRGPNPLALIIDDFQWLDSETIQRLILGLDYTELDGLMLVLCCHDDESALQRARNLLASLANLGFATDELKIETTITGYWVRELSLQTGQSEESIADIAKAMSESPQASPLFVRFAADFLQAGGKLEQLLPDREAFGLFQLRLSEFQAQEREVLGLIACAGGVSVNVLARAAARAVGALDLELLLTRAENSGMVTINQKDGKLHITHDSLQQVCAGPAATWPARSLNLLEAKLADCENLEEQSDEDLFWMVEHVLKAAPLLKLHSLRSQAVQIVRIGSARARSRASLELALKACRVAQSLVLESDDPHLRGKVSREYAVTCWYRGDTENFRSQAFEAEKLLTPLEVVQVTELKLQSAISQGRHAETVDLAVKASRELLPSLPRSADGINLGVEQAQVSELLERLRRITPSDDAAVQAVNRLLTTANAAAYVGAPDLLPSLVAIQLELTEQRGTTEWFPLTLAYWSALLTRKLASLEAAFEIGQLALSMATQNRNGRVEARVRDLVFGTVLCWHGDLRWSIAPLWANKELAFQHGTFEFAGYSLLKNIAYRFFTGDNLAVLERDITSALHEFEMLQHERMCLYLARDLATVRQLRSPRENPADLNDGHFQLESALVELHSDNDRFGLLYTVVNRLLVATIYDESDTALELSEQAEALRSEGPGLAHQGMVSWLGGLAVLAGNGLLADTALQRATKSLHQLKFWSLFAPTTWESRSLQLEAELSRRQGLIAEAESLFEQALKKAEESNSLLDQCVVCLKRAELGPKGRARWRDRAFLALQSWRAGDSDSWFTSRSREESLLGDVVQITNAGTQTDLANAIVDLVRHQLRVKHVSLIARSGAQISVWNPLPQGTVDLVREVLETGESSLLHHPERVECCCPIRLGGQVHSALYATGALSADDRDGTVLFSSLQRVVELAESKLEALKSETYLDTTGSKPSMREALFNSLISESGTALFARDKSGRTLLANRGYAEFVGCSPDDLLGKEISDVVPSQVSQRILADDRTVLEAGRSTENLETFARENGETRSYATVRVPLRDPDGNVVGVCGTSSDVTALCAMARDERQRERLTQLSTFAGKIAHDLRNIINAILGNLELIKLDIEPDSPLLESLDDIEFAAGRTTDLVTRIVEFSRLPPPSKRYFPIGALFEHAAHRTRLQLGSTIPVTVSYENKALELFADPDQLQQVAANLIANALEASADSREDVKILIREVGSKEDPDAENAVEIVVSDKGKGMDENALRRAFDVFFTTKAQGLGHGLGLPITKEVVRAHNGIVNLESSPEGGTCVTLRIPNQACDYEGLVIA